MLKLKSKKLFLAPVGVVGVEEVVGGGVVGAGVVTT